MLASCLHPFLTPQRCCRALQARRTLGVGCLRVRLKHIVAHAVGTACVDPAASGATPLPSEPRWLVAAYVCGDERRLFPGAAAAAAAAYGPPEAQLAASGLFSPDDMPLVRAIALAEAGTPPASPPPAAWLGGDGPAALAARYSLPGWVASLWHAELGPEKAGALAAASNRPGPITLRANTAAGTRETLAAALASEGLSAEPTLLSPWGLCVVAPAKPNIWGSRCFQDGAFEVQDEGSQLIAYACTDGGRLAGVGGGPAVVVDACCGRGGKALALAMLGPAAVLCHDTDPAVFSDLRLRAARAGCAALCRELPDFGRAAGGGPEAGPDVVLVDAPCSRLGILRRGPGTRWELPDPAEGGWTAALPRTQLGLLIDAARLVRPGGIVVYATCTIRRAENEDVCAAFAAAAAAGRCPALAPSPLAEAWGDGAAAPPETVPGANSVTLMPSVSGTDGFFIARFRKPPVQLSE